MPDQKVCTSEPRAAELQVFDDFAVRRAKLGCGKLFTAASSLRGGEYPEFNRVSTALFSKEFGVKRSLCCADGQLAAAAGTSSLNALLTTAKSHHHPLAAKRSLLASSDSTAKLRSTKSPKIVAPALKKPCLKNVGSGPASLVQVAARAVVRSVGTTGSDQAKLQWKHLTAGHEAAFFHQSPAASKERSPLKLEIVETHEAASINPRPEYRDPPTGYRGVRVRPGVKGFLVEIRPKRWKKTIWLGTYPTSPEAARAYDAGIFYTGKSIPYNFQESKDSFSPLPEHLSLNDSDPEIMDQITCFVKGKAREAAARKPQKVEPTLQGPPVLQTGNKKPDHVVSSSSSSSSVNEVQGSCTLLATGLSSDKKGMSLHVKDETDSAGCSDLVNSNPFENLEPLPGNLRHYSTIEQELLPGDDHSLDCWAQIQAQTGVNGYSPQSGILKDKDLCITQQSEYVTEEDMQVPDPPTCCLQSVLPSFENDGNLGNPATLGLEDSWGLLPESLDLGVWDPSLGSDGSLLQKNFLNMESCDSSYVWWHQAKQLHDLTFARTHELPEDVLLPCQNGEDASLKSGCINSVVQEPDDDDEFSVSLWQ